MNRSNKPTDEEIFLYADCGEAPDSGLSPQKIQEIRDYLAQPGASKQVFDSVQKNIDFLRSLPEPQPTETLATRCTAAANVMKSTRATSLLQFANVLAVILIAFVSGWVLHGELNRPIPAKSTELLFEEQSLWISKLEDLSTEQPIMTTINDWTGLAGLKQSQTVLKTLASENKNNLFVQQRICEILEQNIGLMKKLCEYLQSDASGNPVDLTNQTEEDQKFI